MLSQQIAPFNRPYFHIFGTLHGNPYEAILVGLDPVYHVINPLAEVPYQPFVTHCPLDSPWNGYS